MIRNSLSKFYTSFFREHKPLRYNINLIYWIYSIVNYVNKTLDTAPYAILFSLMSLFFLFKRQRNRNIALVSSLIIGFCTGAYKVLVGDHFLSHTIITMICSWIIILLIARFSEIYFQKEQ